MTEKENLMRLYRREIPEWIPCNFEAYALMQPSIINSQGVPGKGGVDLFGVNWLVNDLSATGAIHDPRQHLIEDITKWEEIIQFPDLEAMDWDAAAQKDLAEIDRNEHLVSSSLLDGNFNRLQALMGTCEAMMAMLDEPEAVMDFFEAHTEFRIRLLKKVKDHYALDVFINGDDICSSSGLLFSPDLYKQMIKPYEKRLAKAALELDMMVQHHVCGKCEDIIPDIIETGATVIETMQPGMNDIRKMKELYGKQVIFDGGWDVYGPHCEVDATEEMVRAEMRRSIEEYAYDGSFIMYAGVLFPSHVGREIFWEHTNWIFDECKQYSREYIKKHLL